MNTPDTKTLCAEAYASMKKFHDAIKDAVEKPLLEHIQELESKLIVATSPTPPTADGKTPDYKQVADFLCHIGWSGINDAQWQGLRDALPELRAMFGGQTSLEAGIKRMEAVPWNELPGEVITGESIRARLIAAAREGQTSSQPTGQHGPAGMPPLRGPGLILEPVSQPAVDWQAIVKESIVQLNMDGTTPENLALQINKKIMQRDDIHAKTIARAEDAEKSALRFAEIAYGLQARAEKAEAELALSESAFSAYRGLILSALDEAGAPTHHQDIGAPAIKPMTPQERIKALAKLPQLRPLSEAGDVPDGCVRVFGGTCQGHFILSMGKGHTDTHFADIRLPTAERTAGQKADDSSTLGTPVNTILADIRKPEPGTFEAHGQTWTKHTPGDPMPCDSKAKIDVLDKSHAVFCDSPAHDLRKDFWTAEYWNPIIGRRYADEPKTVIIPLDHSDIRATDEFRPCGEVFQVCTLRHADEEYVSIFRACVCENLTYKDLADNYLRRQHGSTEWKPCTKEKK